jgi:uncharacterized protein YlzI (FlbEa/FlbD family)
VLSKFDTLPGRYTQKVCRTPDQILFKFVDPLIRVNDLPHQLNDPSTSIVIEQLVELPGKAIKIDRATGDCICINEKLSRSRVIEPIMRFENSVQSGAPDIR